MEEWLEFILLFLLLLRFQECVAAFHIFAAASELKTSMHRYILKQLRSVNRSASYYPMHRAGKGVPAVGHVP